MTSETESKMDVTSIPPAGPSPKNPTATATPKAHKPQLQHLLPSNTPKAPTTPKDSLTPHFMEVPANSLSSRPRGRPRKPIDPNAPPVVKRPRGRPRKPVDPNAPPKVAKQRGRPRKSEDVARMEALLRGLSQHARSESASDVNLTMDGTDVESPEAATKLESSATDATTRLFDEDTDVDMGVDVPLSSAFTSVNRQVEECQSAMDEITLSNLIGSYALDCDTLEEKFPEHAQNMRMTITQAPHDKALLVADVHLGPVEGTMLLAASREVVEKAIGSPKQEEDAVKTAVMIMPKVSNGSLHFILRGREKDKEGHVHPVSTTQNRGTLRFTSTRKFEGTGVFETLGVVRYSALKFSPKIYETPTAWSEYD
jgi:hypothetical protein